LLSARVLLPGGIRASELAFGYSEDKDATKLPYTESSPEIIIHIIAPAFVFAWVFYWQRSGDNWLVELVKRVLAYNSTKRL
jgi:hypothetical protein